MTANDITIGEWNHTLTGDFLWTNTNFGEAITEAMTPLTWSVLQFTLDDWVFLPGFSTMGNIAGRPYLNISLFATLFNAIGRSRHDLMDAMEGTLYMQLPEEMEIPLIPLSRRELLIALREMLRMQVKQRRGVKQLPAYLATNLAWFQRVRNELQARKTGEELVELWYEEIKPHVKKGVWIVLGTVSHSSDYTIRLRRDLKMLVGSDDANALIANLSDESGLLPSLGPVIGLAKVASGEMPRQEYLELFGHRGPNEFELSVPRPVEDPQWLNQQIAQFRQSPVDVTSLLKQGADAYQAAWERLASRHPRKAKSMGRRVAESARRARLREHARSEYIRDRWMVSLFARRAGELIGLGADVFYLYLEEVLDVLSGKDRSTRYIPTRRENYNRCKALPPLPSVIRGRFDPFEWVADPHRKTDIFDPQASKFMPLSDSAVGDRLTGSAGSAGLVEGIVRVILNPEDGHHLQNGEILVTIQTDISWTLLFPRAAAVVTDVGAPLSHAAIVARELGIPAVVGCGDAIARLKTGDRVHVDGSRGTVQIMSIG
jgi:pyruvate,water dikinase